MDPLALSANESRYMGHMWIRDKKDLVEEAKNDPSWNSEAVEQLTEGSGISDAGRNKQAEEKTPTRNEVVGYDVWVPEVQHNDVIGPEDGFHGTIYTVSVGQSERGNPQTSSASLGHTMDRQAARIVSLVGITSPIARTRSRPSWRRLVRWTNLTITFDPQQGLRHNTSG